MYSHRITILIPLGITSFRKFLKILNLGTGVVQDALTFRMMCETAMVDRGSTLELEHPSLKIREYCYARRGLLALFLISSSPLIGLGGKLVVYKAVSVAIYTS